jgi:TolB-like protein/Tfp pilus assembly protein PilF
MAGADTSTQPSASDRLDSWKEIAAYLKRDERTVRRWEKSEGLPIHRHSHAKQASVYAYKAEVDAWWNDGRTRLGKAEEAAAPAAPLQRWLRHALAALVLGAVLAVVWIAFRPAPVSAPGDIRLVVLPFANFSGDPEQQHLCDGLTDEITTQLARIEPNRLRVIARTTAMRYRGHEHDVRQIGDELAVDYVLEGSITRVGDRLRVTAQLIQARDQTHLWAQTFDREVRHLLDLQDDLARAIARRIEVVFTPAAARPSRVVDPEAYETFLRARYHHYQGTIPGLQKAIEYYDQAIRKDPAFALAYAGLARAYIFGVRAEPRVALAQAREAARKSVELAPDLPEAQLALAMTRLYADWDWNGAQTQFLRALELDPGNSEAHFYYSHYLAAVGRFDEAVAAARRAQELDPFSPLIGHYVGRHLYFARRYPEALAELQKTAELDPNYPWTYVFLYATCERMKNYDQAADFRQRYWGLLGNPAEQSAELNRLHASAGYPAVLRRWAEWLEEGYRQRGYVTSTELALLYAELGKHDQALRWLDRAVQAHTRDLIYLNVEPGFAALRSDPRFTAILQRIHFSPQHSASRASL